MAEEIDVDSHIDKQLKKLNHTEKKHVASYIDGLVSRNAIFKGTRFQE